MTHDDDGVRLDPAAPDRAESRRFTLDRDQLARDYARCFSGDAGVRVLMHLRGLTRDRVMDPECSEAALRALEGQRRLLAMIETQIAQGRAGPPPTNTDH
jgi:hypothetical protein